jgi:ubiquinone/menaquinone biosynthesis C-methylase UbiE
MRHHLPSDLKRRGLAEIARVLKPGGRLLIVNFKRPTTHWAQMLYTLIFHGTLRGRPGSPNAIVRSRIYPGAGWRFALQ